MRCLHVSRCLQGSHAAAQRNHQDMMLHKMQARNELNKKTAPAIDSKVGSK